jgi:Plasmid pRiA4b ORF-3-like protein
MADVPKRIKRLLREYAGAAHEEELRRALLPVSEAFGRWARRELSSGDLSEIIHRFHQGPARELWVRYNTRHLEMPVAFAITTGVLGRETIPAELLEHLAGALRFYEEEQADASGDRGQEFEVQALNQRETSSIGMMATAQVYQFKLALVGVEPPIWRRIQVPEDYSFWDLHVALQDAMGWLDYHLHVFRVAGPGADEVEQIGIPDDDPFEGDKPTLPGWEIPITRHFLRPGTAVPYEYDFGDGWEHELTLEAILPRQAARSIPLRRRRQGLPTRGLRRRPWLRDLSDRDPGPHSRGVREHPRVARWSIRPRQVRPKAREVRRPCPPLSARVRGASRAGSPETSHDNARSDASQAVAQKHRLNEPPQVTDPVDSTGSHSPELPARIEKTRRGDRTPAYSIPCWSAARRGHMSAASIPWSSAC